MSKVEGYGIGLSSTLGIILAVFKVIGVVGIVDIPWIWILCPFWIPLSIKALVFLTQCIKRFLTVFLNEVD